MFDFTTTTFIHDASMIEANPGSTQNFLRIGNHSFKYEDIAAIYRNPYVAPANAKLVVDIAGFMAKAKIAPYNGKRFKLDFYLKRSGDNNSFYSNDFVFKGKDFHYEWTAKQDNAEKVANMINKIIKLYGDVYLNVYVEDSKLVFENDNYGIFTEAQLKVYNPGVSNCCEFIEGAWETLDELCGPVSYCETDNECETPIIPCRSSENNTDYYDSVAGMGGWLTAYDGVNGFGTYEQLLKDLRLPTMENLRWMSPTASEMPIPGNKYVQYTFHQISCRGVLGGSAVGEVTHSKTTHVFFVPTCGCSEDTIDAAMLTAIEAAGMDKLLLSTDAQTVGHDAEKGSMDGPAIISDPSTNPMEVENFEHDSSIKADTTNSDAHPHTQEAEPEPSNP